LCQSRNSESINKEGLRTVATSLEELAQTIAIPHLRDDREGLAHPIHLIRLILDLRHILIKPQLSLYRKQEVCLPALRRW
jgi:hypothetical protein